MLTLSAKIREITGKKVKSLRKKGLLPAVLYGPARIATQSVAGRSKIKSLPLEIDLKEFEKVYQEAGESTLISLEITDEKKKYLVLIHDLERDPLTEKPIHVDFYQPRLEEKVEVTVPIIFEGEAPAVKDLGGTLIKNISEVGVKALPQKLPKEIKVRVGDLRTFEDNILIKDLELLEGVKILREPKEIVASVSPPEKVEEELVKPIEEKVEEVEKVEKKEESE